MFTAFLSVLHLLGFVILYQLSIWKSYPVLHSMYLKAITDFGNYVGERGRGTEARDGQDIH